MLPSQLNGAEYPSDSSIKHLAVSCCHVCFDLSKFRSAPRYSVVDYKLLSSNLGHAVARLLAVYSFEAWIYSRIGWREAVSNEVRQYGRPPRAVGLSPCGRAVRARQRRELRAPPGTIHRGVGTLEEMAASMR